MHLYKTDILCIIKLNLVIPKLYRNCQDPNDVVNLMNKKLWIVLLLGAMLSLVGCATQANAAAPIGDPDAGRVIYETGGDAGIPCMSCHSTDGTKIVGPSWQGLADRAATRVDGLSAVDYLRQSIKEPTAYVVEGYDPVMPAVFGESLSDDDIDNVIAYILSLD
jgi:cytochrome c551/c552